MSNNNDKKTQRPPIVVVMGHIDHGKSQLLDYVRKTNVVKQEAGGITQHIGAYEAEVEGKKITFLDTPGHAAFSKIRSRGAKVADIAILVIAASEGVKPQTIEAHEAIQESGIPFVVALNKMDLPEAAPDSIKKQLTEKQIFVENYGGSIPCTNISAKTGEGVDELLEMVLLLTEMGDFKANPNENASGTIIESNLDPKRGISTTAIIQNGTIKKGMFIATQNAIAPLRIFEDFQGERLEEATFSSPVIITGFNAPPLVGSEFRTFNTKKEAEKWMKEQTSQEKTDKTQTKEKMIDGGINSRSEVIIIPIVIKADVSGSLEAVEKEIKKLESEEVQLNILRKGIGDINEDDTRLASTASDAIALGFNVQIDPSALTLVENFNILVKTSTIIYKISEWLEEEIEKRKAASTRERIIGQIKVLKTFSRKREKQLIGGEILDGKVIKKARVKIIRNEEEIGKGKVIELQRKKDKVDEINEKTQFGTIIESAIDITSGDIIEVIDPKSKTA